MSSKLTTFAILVLVFSLSIFGCLIGGAPKPTATPATTVPPLAGRILLLQNGEGNTMTLFEFKDGLQAPQTLWTGIPGRLPESSEALQPIIVASPNHQYAMLVNSHSAITILNLTDGTSTTIGLPKRKYSSEIYDIAASFSPDSRYLAYALTGSESSHSGLYLVDLVSQWGTALFEGPCHTYAEGPTIKLVCGEVERPVWLDDTTLAFSAFGGEPPSTNIGTHIGADRTFVMDVDGKVLQEFNSLKAIQADNMLLWFIGIDDAAGPTVLQTNAFNREGSWYEASDIKKGVIKPATLKGKIFLLTPDGQSILRIECRDGAKVCDLEDNVLHLTDLRRGSDLELPTLWLISCQTYRQRISDEPPTISWSPDGKEIACLSGQELDVHSIQGLSQRTWLENFDGYLVDWTP